MVIIDRTTGLMWEHSGSREPIQFESAQLRLKEMNRMKYAGFSDWRIPTLEELMAYVKPDTTINPDQTLFKGALPLHIDPMFDSQPVLWTADTFGAQFRAQPDHWIVDFITGQAACAERTHTVFVRMVRTNKITDR
ncbi:MAG: DUF1566 domain-containing protein [Desulfobulbaceae bacterium]|nr:DUF1566 domain-containing protein [Desulfobulbaceae bacterium]